MNSHKRQSSSGSFSNNDMNHLETSFSRLENFMIISKLMQDEIMVPSKLKDKTFGLFFFYSLSFILSQIIIFYYIKT